MLKKSIVGVEARDKAIKGADYVAEAVKSTLGPHGLNAMFEKGNRITNDGVSVARELCTAIEDEYERRGALVLLEASTKTNDQVGDATSTSMALAQAIVKESIKHLPNKKTIGSKKTPSQVKKQIEDSVSEVISLLEKQVTTIETKEQLIKSAMVSVENEELAEIIGTAQWELGENGMILVEETAENKTYIQKVKGIRIDNGFGASFMMNNQEKQTLEIENVEVIYTNYTIQDLQSLSKVLDRIVKSGKRNIAIIARAFTPEAIRLCAENHKNGVFLWPINAPYTDQGEVMRDMEAVLGGKFVEQEEMELVDVDVEHVGFAERIVARRFDAILTGKDDPVRVNYRISQLKQKLEGEQSDFAKNSINLRIAQLDNGFAILKVGATSEAERKYKKDKCDDAVNAVRLALKGGTVKGAGLAFKEISESLSDENILKKPLLCINEQIMYLAPEGFVVEEWVRDPFLVLKAALENAASVAAVFATTNALVVSKNPHVCKCAGAQQESYEG